MALLARRVLLAVGVCLALASPVRAQSETVEYYATDAVGSVRVVFNANGNILGRMDYAPFGGELSGGTNLPDQRFAGLFRDGEAGLDYAQARSYQVRTGRFNAPDPVYAGMFNPQGWNRYAYALNSPHVYVDPTGLQNCVLSSGRLGFCSGTAGTQPSSPERPDLPWGWSGAGGDGFFMVDVLGLDVDVSGGGGGGDQDSVPNPNPSPNPNPNPDPEEPEMDLIKAAWKRTKRVMRCAAATSNTISIASYLGGFGGTKAGQILGGNDIAAFSDLIAGDDRGQSAVDVGISNPSKWNVISLAARLGLAVPIPVRFEIAQNSAGTWYARSSASTVGQALAKTSAGKALAVGVALYTIPKLGYDLGTYGGSMYHCASR
jgi:RHS repeat-associated protein